MNAVVAALGITYMILFIAFARWRRRRPCRVAVLCPLRESQVPREIRDVFPPPTRIDDPERFLDADFVIAHVTDRPGIALASVTDEASLERVVGPYLANPIFAPEPERYAECLAGDRWRGELLYELALEVLHVDRPRSLAVDLRPGPPEVTRARRISTTESDLDLAMYAWDIRCRLQHYSAYRSAQFFVLCCDTDGAWLFGDDLG